MKIFADKMPPGDYVGCHMYGEVSSFLNFILRRAIYVQQMIFT